MRLFILALGAAFALAAWAAPAEPPEVVCDHPTWTAGDVPYTTVATCAQAGRPVVVVLLD